MKKQITQESKIWLIAKAFLYVVMVLAALSFVVMFAWILINSFKTPLNYMNDVFGLPQEEFGGFDFKNYLDVLTFEYKEQNLFQMLGNTVALILINVFCALSFPVMAGYVFGRMEFKGRAKFEAMLYVLMTIPVIGAAGSTLNFLDAVGLNNTFGGIFIISSASFGSGMLVLTSLFRGLPSSYAEAAYIDGAGEWQVFTRIYYPQASSLLSINVIATIIGVWNDYMTGYLYLPDHPTIALGLQQLQRKAGFDYPIMFAGIVLTMIPVFIVFSFIAKRIFNSTDLGALK